MFKRSFFWPFCLLLLISLTPVLAETGPAPSPIERSSVNGMTILLQKSSSEVVEIALLLKSGSGLDPAEKKGTAEIMNSLVFVKLKYGEVELGDVDVNTYPDYTLIKIRTTAANLKEALQEIMDLLTQPLYSFDLMNDIKGLYITDLKSFPVIAKSYRDFNREFYGANHPYDDVLNPETMAAINGYDVYKWYRQTYQPGNAILSITGEINLDIKDIHDFFTNMPSEAVDHRLLVNPVQIAKTRNLEKEDLNGRVTSVSIGFAAPRLQDPEFPAFWLISYYLGEYQHYFEELRVKEGLLYAEYVYYNYLQKPKAPSLAFITMTEPQSLDEVEKKTIQLVEVLITNGIAQDELNQAVKAFKISSQAREKAGKGLATSNALSYYFQNQLVYDRELLRKIEQVKTEDIKKAAAKYLRNYIRVAYIPAKIADDL